MRVLSSLLAVAALLSGCGEPFLNPAVACPLRTLAFGQTTSPSRAGQACSFGEYPFTIAYAPTVDTLRDPRASDYSLVRGRVSVTALNYAVLLCAGSAQQVCMGGVSQLAVTIGDNGQLAYQAVFGTDGLNLMPGGSFKGRTPLVSETFGPGNTCQIDADVDFSCQMPVK